MGNFELTDSPPLQHVVFPDASESGPLLCRLRACAHEQRRDEPYDWHGLHRGADPFVLIQHSLEGAGLISHGTADPTVVGPGSTMVLALPQAHRYWLPAGGSWRFLWAICEGPEALRCARLHQERRGPLSDDTRLGEALASVVRQAIGGGIAGPHQASAAAYSLAMAMLDSAGSGAGGIRPDERAAIDQACQWVEARLGQDLQVADIAAQAGMSQWHFSRLFRLAVGESPAKWVLRRRCLQGARLLATTSESIASIAGRCGFSDPGYFAKAFGRLQGCSPRDFRRSGRWGGE